MASSFSNYQEENLSDLQRDLQPSEVVTAFSVSTTAHMMDETKEQLLNALLETGIKDPTLHQIDHREQGGPAIIIKTPERLHQEAIQTVQEFLRQNGFYNYKK